MCVEHLSFEQEEAYTLARIRSASSSNPRLRIMSGTAKWAEPSIPFAVGDTDVDVGPSMLNDGDFSRSLSSGPYLSRMGGSGEGQESGAY